jgi:hypothetical protein
MTTGGGDRINTLSTPRHTSLTRSEQRFARLVDTVVTPIFNPLGKVTE